MMKEANVKMLLDLWDCLKPIKSFEQLKIKHTNPLIK